VITYSYLLAKLKVSRAILHLSLYAIVARTIVTLLFFNFVFIYLVNDRHILSHVTALQVYKIQVVITARRRLFIKHARSDKVHKISVGNLRKRVNIDGKITLK